MLDWRCIVLLTAVIPCPGQTGVSKIEESPVQASRRGVRPEERMMFEQFGYEYIAYIARTQRLVPGVW